MSTIYLIYLAIIAIALIVGGTILAYLSFSTKLTMTNLWATYRSWVIMIVPAMLCIFLGRVAVIALVAILAILAIVEFGKATRGPFKTALRLE